MVLNYFNGFQWFEFKNPKHKTLRMVCNLKQIGELLKGTE